MGIFETLVCSIFSKIGDKLIDHGDRIVSGGLNIKSVSDSLKRSLDSLTAKASDVDEQIKNSELSGKKKRKREVEDWLKQVQVIQTELSALENEADSEGFVSKFLGSDRAPKLQERVDKLVEQSRHFGELVLDACDIRGEALLTTKLVGKAFEENVERIWKLLVTDKVPIIGIYGMGGAGKTTLTKHIHNRLLEELTQECVFWITVSQEFSITMLQDGIARAIKLDLSDERDEDKRAARLHKALLLLGKKFVLILDDLWENDLWDDIILEKLGDPLRVEGCQLIITSRSSDVCRQMNCQELIQVEPLDMDGAWNLFCEIHGRQRQTTLNRQVEEIAKSMVKMCDGLPLGIITVAGSMRGVTEVHAWRDAMEELQESATGNDRMDVKVFKVLKYSFDQLDSVLQHCFLYCALYPEDWDISREELVRRFITEELVEKRKRMKAQIDKGHTILDKLVSVCLLERTRDDDDRDCVKMHDLVRSMALKITEGKTMVKAGGYRLKEIPNEEVWTKDLEKVSLVFNDIERIPDCVYPNCPKLSTLLLCWNLDLHYIADSFFSKMHGLRTLDLSGTEIKELPNSVSDLESLKALILRDCSSLVCISNLEKLKELRELDLSFTPIIREVPQGLGKLVNLEFLSLRDFYGSISIFPTDVLVHLRKLKCLYLPYYVEAPIGEIEMLKEMEEFEGRFKDVPDFDRFIQSQKSKGYAVSYRIQVGDLLHYEFFDNDMNFSSVEFSSTDFKTTREEREVVTLLASDTQQLTFDECEGLSKCLSDDFNIPGYLHIFKIELCHGIESILKDEQLIMFSSLRRLWILYCNKMKKLGLRGSGFPYLEELWIIGCPDIEVIIQAVASENVDLPKLKSLEIRDLPKLKNICEAKMMCGSIEKIELWGCPLLKKLPLHFPGELVDGQMNYSPPPALEEIVIMENEREWWESLEWDHPSHGNLLQPFLTFEEPSPFSSPETYSG
ncbi:hypothetical protein ABFS82_04G150000 [Erythranthe guttata]|uniref:probable disease resistance protein At4g27220 n=1 Tax=Erythranthe guttata TaxID=4155 RepID=UPI00064D7FE3|nr:PREDICTED: probable disease resistance protein At4g27220 [Erythranthe guttata]|eukprot:XP_012853943.1 PREDICTED: probable disease resistance protein At4g27220 [Erythranthe guttata]